MRTLRRSFAVMACALLLMLLPSAVLAQSDGGFGTDPQIVAPGPAGIVVTDVTVASLDGFDRITFDIDGERAGWRVDYVDNPVTQGQGAPVQLAGEATLRVALNTVLVPPDAPPGTEFFGDDVPGPEGGVVTEIFNGSIFEGDHEFFVGVTQRLPFRVQRLEDPQRVVIDIVNDAPVGGVATGLGGAVDTAVPESAIVFGVAIVLALIGADLAVRRSRS